jgi:hypothetical protein
VFLDQNPRRQRVSRVVIQHRNGALHDNRPAVQLRGDQMNGHTTGLHAMLNCLTLSVDPGKRWKQRWVNVQNRIGERFEERQADEAHIPCEAYEADVACAKLPNDGSIVLIARGNGAVRKANRVNAGEASALEPGGILAIGNDDGDCRVEAAVTRGVDERLQIASAA